MNAKTLHPLISVIDLDGQTLKDSLKTDSFAVVVRYGDVEGKQLGCRRCDFTAGALSFYVPDAPIDLSQGDEGRAKGRLLVFHPGLLCGLPLAKELRRYTFFKYKKTEALHLSQAELNIVDHCLDHIQAELKWGVDRFSAPLLASLIDTLLRYCQRYYERQFVLRHEDYLSQLRQLTRQLDDYIRKGRVAQAGTPCACHFARRYGWSSAYLNDFLRHETGCDFTDYFELRRQEMVRRMRREHLHQDTFIAHLLGFETVARMRQVCPFVPSSN